MLALALSTLLPAGLASADASCPGYAAMIDGMVGNEVGTSSLVQQMLAVTVSSESGLSRNFNPRDVMTAVGVKLRRGVDCPRGRAADSGSWACEYRDRRDTNAVLRIDLREGYVAFLDPTRSFDPAGPAYQVTSDEALAVATSLIAPFGIPSAEVDVSRPHVWARTAFAGTAREAASSRRRTELDVDLYRRVGGWRVFGSRLRVAVDGQRRPARVHLDWPDFQLASGLSAQNALTRAEIVAQATEAIGEVAGCGIYQGVTTMVGWVDSRELGFVDDSDEANGANAGGYVPALIFNMRGPLAAAPLPDGQKYVARARTLYVPLVRQGDSADE